MCSLAAALFTVAAHEGPKAILDMDAIDVGNLLARIGVTPSASPVDPSYDGAALVDFIRWYDSMPRVARFIEANNGNACKAWETVARYMDTKQQVTSSSPNAFLEW
jgi:hypothetical protein